MPIKEKVVSTSRRRTSSGVIASTMLRGKFNCRLVQGILQQKLGTSGKLPSMDKAIPTSHLNTPALDCLLARDM